jgi:hypothetical protein
MAQTKSTLSTWERIVLQMLPSALAILSACLTSPSLRQKLRTVFANVVAVGNMAQTAFADDFEFSQEVKNAEFQLSGKN